MDLPTEEEEFELMYGEELNMVEDDQYFDEEAPTCSKYLAKMDRIASTQKTLTSTIVSSPKLSQIPKPKFQEQFQENQAGTSTQSSIHSPQLSVISKDGNNWTPGLRKGAFASSTPAAALLAQNNNAALSEIQNIGLHSRKRRLEALFGDIYDIEEEDDGTFKKHKTDEEKDLETIERILEARKKFQEQLNPMKKSNLDRLENLHKFKKDNLSISVPKWPFLTVQRNDGERIYVRFHSEDFETRKLNEISCYNRNSLNLLGDNSHAVWDQARQIVLEATENRATQQAITDISNTTHHFDAALWVEKYRPKKYVDLLSDESTNRSFLQWMKLWDKVVFNREVKNKEKGPLNTFNKRTGRFETGGWRPRNKHNLNTDLDANNVPVQKMALLCGPPGLGKTTLAAIVARHCGYNILEQNASDDRSIEAFRQVLENGTQMKSVLNPDNRPNCIILDEIDGAPIQSIDYLIRFATGQVTQKSKKGKSTKKFILKRPIICICNDVYAASLRQLRQIAFVVNFTAIESSRLAERLQFIAYREKIKTDLNALMALAEKSGNDIRSCLTVLQFHSGSNKPLRLIDVLKSNVGRKDLHKGLFSVWNSIFQIQRPKKTVNFALANNNMEVVAMTDTSATTRMTTVLDIIHACGDYERLVQGIFENYLQQKMPDPNLEGVVEADDWFCFNDCLQTKINTLQNYSLYPYLDFAFVTWHYLFATMAYPKIQFPHKSYEVSQKSFATKMIFNSLKKGLSASMKGIGDGYVLLMDSLCLIKYILSPQIRSVSLQLLSPKERYDLQHAVEVMVDLGLTYKQLLSPEGSYVYQIEPDIEHLAKFNNSSSQQLNYWSKQIIAREVDLEYMKRSRPKGENSGTLMPPPTKTTSVTSAPTTSDFMKQRIGQPQRNERMDFKTKTTPQDSTSKDFFGRIRSKVASTTDSSDDSDVLLRSPIWFKFKEGFNNAVRKDVLYGDLL